MTETQLARFIREQKTLAPGVHSKEHAQAHTTENSSTTQIETEASYVHTIENMHEGVRELQIAIDDKLDTHWKAFRHEYRQHWQDFNTNYIQPSVQFIGNEKKCQ